jgi:hypothetical protein
MLMKFRTYGTCADVIVDMEVMKFFRKHGITRRDLVQVLDEDESPIFKPLNDEYEDRLSHWTVVHDKADVSLEEPNDRMKFPFVRVKWFDGTICFVLHRDHALGL